APPNSPHSSTRSLFTKIRRKASILSLTSPIIGGSGKKLSAQGGAGGGPCSSPRAFSLDDLVKTSVSTARSRTPSPRKRRNNSTPTKNKTEAEEIFKKLVKKPSSDDSNIQETCFSIGSDVNLKEKKVVTFATIEQTCPPVSTEQTCPVTQQSDVPLSDTAPTEQSSTSPSKSNQSSSKVRTRVSPSTAPVLSSQSSNPGSDSLSSSDLAIPTLTESDIVRPLTLAACSADSILAMFRNFSSSLPSHNVGGGGGVNRSSALVSATTSPTCTSPQSPPGMLCALTMCELEPCLFGSCELTPIGYKCHCQEGYRGVTCDVRIRPCDNSPCNGHGQCVEKSDRRYVCRCYAWWKGENCSERILHIPQTPLAERMLQEPFWLGLITVTVVLLVLGMFWCARRHFPDKLEKLLAEENERSRHHYPSSSSRSHLGHSHHHCVHSHACSHPMGSGHIPVPTTGAPPNSPHSSTRSLFTKIRRKASILSLTSPIIGGSGKKLSAQGGAGGGPCSSPRAFSLDDLVKTSVSTARSSKTHYIWVCYEPYQVPVMDQKSMNTNPGPTILLEVPSSNKGGLSPIHEVPTPALTPVMQRHSMNSGMSDNS
ncbi:protein HEG homolog 1-like, partial [Diaphorina citri]|uniref:Protein HEG homolog 1-like n=1 Tax=Diaphorina citri TaxID=121845 RepID=A0A3Q0JGQ3_DIACI